MEELIEKIKSDTGNTTDMIFRKMIIDQKPLYLVYNEVLTSSDDINNFNLKKCLHNLSLYCIIKKRLRCLYDV